jgi:hypothetical protein
MLVTSGITAQHGCIFDGGLKLGLLFAQAMHPRRGLGGQAVRREDVVDSLLHGGRSGRVPFLARFCRTSPTNPGTLSVGCAFVDQQALGALRKKNKSASSPNGPPSFSFSFSLVERW